MAANVMTSLEQQTRMLVKNYLSHMCAIVKGQVLAKYFQGPEHFNHREHGKFRVTIIIQMVKEFVARGENIARNRAKNHVKKRR
jgi:hypothetical protein